MWGNEPSELTDIMLSFWRLAVMKRLGGSSNRPMMNGMEFIQQIEPEFRGIAYYRLQNYREQFKFLDCAS